MERQRTRFDRAPYWPSTVDCSHFHALGALVPPLSSLPTCQGRNAAKAGMTYRLEERVALGFWGWSRFGRRWASAVPNYCIAGSVTSGLFSVGHRTRSQCLISWTDQIRISVAEIDHD